MANETFSNELPNIVAAPTSLVKHFIAFRGGADGPAGLLLAINPASVSHITSYYDKKLAQNILRIHLNNGRHIMVYEPDVADTLEKLGLEEFVEDWTFNLEKDIA